MRTLKNPLTAVATLALCAVAVPIRAVPIAPGGTVSTPGTTAAARPELVGTVLVDQIRPFSRVVGGIVVRGAVQDRVVRETGTGELDFYSFIRLLPTSTAAIVGLERSNFGPPAALADVDWRIDSLGTTGSVGAIRSADGRSILFNLGDGILPGSMSHALMIHTRARRFRQGGVTVLHWRRGGLAGVIPLRTMQPAY